jgi:methyltransferase (TIGR00027 family)
MSERARTNVEVTADGLIALRTRSPLARRLGIEARHDHLFVTEAGRGLAAMAAALDPVYEQYNLVRYRWFAERLAQCASFRQILVLGAGYDTRTLALPPAEGRQVFEVDLPSVLASKRAVLQANAVSLPAGLCFVAADLASDRLPQTLEAAGFDRVVPTAMLAEGVTFFLPAPAVARLLDPVQLGLAGGGVVAFDAWTSGRIDSLNRKVMEKTGKPLFGGTPLGHSPDEIAATLTRKGYDDIDVRSLGAVSRAYGVDEVADPLGDSWFVVSARVR